MIIDDIRLNDAGASNDRDGYAAEIIGPNPNDLDQLVVEAEAEPTAPASPAAADSDSGIDSPLGIYFRDIARIPLLTAEQEVDLAKKLERGELAKAGSGTVRRRAETSYSRSTRTSRSGRAHAPP